jgi:predicted ester cyclase
MAQPETEAKPAKRTTKRQAVEQRVRSAFDALARRDADAIGEHWREDGVNDIVPIGVLRGRREIVDFFREVFAAVPDLETTVTRVVPGERQAAVEWRMRGNFTGGPFQGIDPTGRRVDLRGFDLLELEDDMIVSITTYYDGAAFARQVGMLPTEGSSAERAMKNTFNAVTKVRKALAERTGNR